MKLTNPRPFLLLSSQYSGSSMLAYALDSHIDIRCDRAEPFGLSQPEFNPIVKFVEPADRIRLALKAYGYEAAGCKVQSDQLMQGNGDDVRAAILELQPLVIRLTRDPVRQVVSRLTRSSPATMTLVPFKVVEWYRYYEQARQAADEWLAESGLPVLPVTYEELTVDHDDIHFLPMERAVDLCKFLGVDHRRLTVPFSRRPSTVVSNWDEVQTALKQEGVAA